MRLSLSLPELGTGDETVSVSGWLVDRGDLILEGDRIVEVLVSGVTFDVEATHSGRLVEISKPVDATLTHGEILGWIDSRDDVPPDSCHLTPAT
jgi:pyruvate/2-oxoglutarate dehydrogenase complex dihydrolipoamide acyltransferase (E2) component